MRTTALVLPRGLWLVTVGLFCRLTSERIFFVRVTRGAQRDHNHTQNTTCRPPCASSACPSALPLAAGGQAAAGSKSEGKRAHSRRPRERRRERARPRPFFSATRRRGDRTSGRPAADFSVCRRAAGFPRATRTRDGSTEATRPPVHEQLSTTTN